VLVFRSSGTRGFSAAVADHPQRREARKRESEVTVSFTGTPCTINTREGVVHARRGDAILRGTAGEQWRVSAARFPEKYRALPPTVAGEPGRYVSLRNRVQALLMNQPFEVVLADGESRLQGGAGDWLVDYGDGSLGIVAAAIFPTTYELTG
jgi:hypothetical protein